MTGRYLADLTWQQAQALLDEARVLVLPLGAGAKEHGPHLRLDNDRVLAEYFAERLRAVEDVLVLPTLVYHYYPAFTDYPGSVSLERATAANLTFEVCASLAAHGARRFYCLNTGFSTLQPLGEVAERLAAVGSLFAFTDLPALLEPVAAQIGEQVGGTHADEVETSMMLHIAPERVDMRLAVCDYHPGRGLSRRPVPGKAWSASGVYGDATLASRAKGERFVAAVEAGIGRDIGMLRAARLPSRL